MHELTKNGRLDLGLLFFIQQLSDKTVVFVNIDLHLHAYNMYKQNDLTPSVKYGKRSIILFLL